MKFVLFVVAAFAAIQAINCNVDSDDDNEKPMDSVQECDYDHKNELMDSVRQHIRENHVLERMENKIERFCPGYGSHFQNVTLEIRSCLVLIDERQETMCSMIQNHFKRCLMPLTNMFEECLPNPSKEVPNLLIDMIIALFKRICKTDGEHILELGNPCIMNIERKTTKCASMVGTKVQESNKKYPSPQVLCEVLEGLRSCLESHLQSACGRQITRESFLSMYDEALSVCRRRNLSEELKSETHVQ